jgi:Ni,Fe-hydrogenase III large subunit/Ni,Fe-hydrogenase III component G
VSVLASLPFPTARIAAPLPMHHARVDAPGWRTAAATIAKANGRLVALWGSASSSEGPQALIAAAYGIAEGLLWIDLPLEGAEPRYPDISALFPAASRMQRAARDLAGVVAEGADDRRPWLDHGAWPTTLPLRVPARTDDYDAPNPRPASPSDAGNYAFVPVHGDGVHEIPVGPVHAGIIEPGHFRFSIVGEKVLRLEERLGYTHKGVERRFTEMAPLEAHRLAGRISGDSTVAYAWAYCMALEAATAVTIPERAAFLRALMLERERVANHLGDLGALGNDAGLAFGLAQFSRLKEDWLRASKNAFGHRFMMDVVAPGGVAVDPPADALRAMRAECDALERSVGALRAAYDEHAGLQDRFRAAGIVSPELAARLGLTGMAGRASGQTLDLRRDQPWAPYDGLAVNVARATEGDVAARVAVRFDETLESLRLVRALCERMPDGPVRVGVATQAPARGAGWIEGWRGEVVVALDVGADDGSPGIRRCHVHDPSWQNWPVLEHAIIGNIVPDFPLINKSFNLTYSGHDL